jgi:hypothetical protein
MGFLLFHHIDTVHFQLEYANREAKTLLGIEPANGRVLRFSDCFFGSQKRRLARNLLKVLKTGRRFESDEVFYGKDITDRYVYQFAAYSLTNKDLIVTLRDITKQKRGDGITKEQRTVTNACRRVF